MRRKSTRNVGAKASPEKSKEEKPTKSTAARKSTRRRKQSTSGTGSESESESIAPSTQIETILEETKATPAEDVWKVTQTTDSHCSGEIKKLKISLSRPMPSTPERASRRLRKKSVSIPDEELVIEEKPTRRTRRGRASPKKEEQPKIDESEDEEAEEKKGKGKSKGKTKSKLDKTPQISEAELQTELCKNVQVTSQSPNIDQVDNIDDDADNIEPDSKQNEDDKINLKEVSDCADNNESELNNEPPELSPVRTEDSNDNIVEEMPAIDNITDNSANKDSASDAINTKNVSTNEVVTSKDVETEVISKKEEDINKADDIEKNADKKSAKSTKTSKKVLVPEEPFNTELKETATADTKVDTEKIEITTTVDTKLETERIEVTTTVDTKPGTERIEETTTVDSKPSTERIEETTTVDTKLDTEKIEEIIVEPEKLDHTKVTDKIKEVEAEKESKAGDDTLNSDNKKIKANIEVASNSIEGDIIIELSKSTKSKEKDSTEKVRPKKPSRFDQKPTPKEEVIKSVPEDKKNVTDFEKLSKLEENVSIPTTSLEVEKVDEKATTIEEIEHKKDEKLEEKEHKIETKIEEQVPEKEKATKIDLIKGSRVDVVKTKKASKSEEKVTEKERIKITFKLDEKETSKRTRKSSRFDVKEISEKDKTKKSDDIKESPDNKKSLEEKPERERVKITFKSDDKSASEKERLKRSDEKVRTISTDDEKRITEKDNVKKSSKSEERIKISFTSDGKEKPKKITRFDIKETHHKESKKSIDEKEDTKKDQIATSIIIDNKELSKNEITKSTKIDNIGSLKLDETKKSDAEKTPEIDRNRKSVDSEDIVNINEEHKEDKIPKEDKTLKEDKTTKEDKTPKEDKTVVEKEVSKENESDSLDTKASFIARKEIKADDEEIDETKKMDKSVDFTGFENDLKDVETESKMVDSVSQIVELKIVPEEPPLPREIIRTKKWGTKSTGLSTFNLLEVNVTTISEIYPELCLVDESEVTFEEIPTRARRRSSAISEHEPRSKERKVSIEERPKYAREMSERATSESDSKEEAIAQIPIDDNIIAMNRKISIVDDSAGKLKAPPTPAQHEVSEVLFISNLVRPFTLKQLKELLERTGKLKEDGFWTDRIKSKCYVCYETSEEAEATRNALHGVHWPIGNGKKLMIDYATPEDIENAKNPPAPIPVKVPEVPQKENKEPDHEAMNRTREEVEDEKEREEQRKSNPNVREWDLGKEEAHKRPSSRSHDRGRERSPKRRSSRSKRSRSPSDDFMKRKQKKVDNAVPQRAMDDLFKKTEATPCIYWQPLTPEEIAMKQQQRMERMEEHKRRMAHTTFASNRGGNRGSDHPRGGPYRRRY